MQHRIILCGENGAGKSTLGKALAGSLHLRFMDIEDYYFPVSNADYPYAQSRTQEEATALLLADMKRTDGFVLAAVKADYGQQISDMFTVAIRIHVPKDIRMQRVRERSRRKFGDRMLPGGDLFEKEQRFFDMVQNRPEDAVDKWLDTLCIPVIHIDGQHSTQENVQYVVEQLSSGA